VDSGVEEGKEEGGRRMTSSGKEYSFLAVSRCQSVEEQVQAEDKRRAAKMSKAKSLTSVAKKLIAGAFKLRRLPSSCYAPRKTVDFGSFEHHHHPEEEEDQNYYRNNVGRSSSVKYPPRHLQAKV
jgi:hypothetical protein